MSRKNTSRMGRGKSTNTTILLIILILGAYTLFVDPDWYKGILGTGPTGAGPSQPVAYPDASGECPSGWEAAFGKTITFVGTDDLAGSALGTSYYVDLYDAANGVDNAVPLEIDLQLASTGLKATSSPYATGRKLVWWIGDNTAVGTANTLVFYGKDLDNDGDADPLNPNNPEPFVVPCLTPGTNEQASTIYVPLRVKVYDSAAAHAVAYGATQITVTTGYINKTSGATPGTSAFSLDITLSITDNKGWQSSYDFINHESHEPLIMLYLNKQTDAVTGIVLSGGGMTCWVAAAGGTDTYCLARLPESAVTSHTTDSGKTYIDPKTYTFTHHMDMSTGTYSNDDSRYYLTVFMGDYNYFLTHGMTSTAQGTNPCDIVADAYRLLTQ